MNPRAEVSIIITNDDIGIFLDISIRTKTIPATAKKAFTRASA